MLDNIDSSPLSASALEAFLDETEQALDQQYGSELAPALIQENLRCTLGRQQYRADTLASVRRLATLWSRAGAPDAALRVLDQDGPAVLAAVPGNEYDDSQLRLAFTRVEVLGNSPAHGLAAAAEAAYLLLRGPTRDAQSDDAWDYLGALASRAGLHELERRCADGRHAFQSAQPGRAPYRAYDKAWTGIWCGHSYAREGLADQARGAAADAIKAFDDAGPDQDLDLNDWLRLGDSLVTLMPDGVATIVERVHALTPAEAGLPLRRDIAIRIARLQARALYQQGALVQALETARAGRYALRGDRDDTFSAQVLEWLLEAGQHEAAAALAFESVFNERQVSADHACRVALAQLSGKSPSSPYWPLALAWASTVEETGWVVGREDPAGFFGRHLQLARADGVALPAIDAVEGLCLVDGAEDVDDQDYAKALPLLESAARDPALATSEVVSKVWLCRMRLHGVERALQMPFVDSACAGWCYNIGVHLLNDTHDRLVPGSAWPEQAVDALAARYYERGAAQFEHFFATGQGMYRDADIHAYSMLCNNLAIHYRSEKSDYQGALALHLKGIDASSFAEHYNGVMKCFLALEDEARFIDAADQLWHYAADYGYSRHTPSYYIDDVAGCLHRQGRGREIPIWLQRLDEWWESQDDGERSEQGGQYWDALSVTLYYMGYSQQADALARLEAVLPDLRAAGRPRATRIAANSLRRAGQHERALPLYQLALSQIVPGNQWHAQQHTYTLDDLEECKRQIRAKRPWWKFWG